MRLPDLNKETTFTYSGMCVGGGSVVNELSALGTFLLNSGCPSCTGFRDIVQKDRLSLRQPMAWVITLSDCQSVIHRQLTLQYFYQSRLVQMRVCCDKDHKFVINEKINKYARLRRTDIYPHMPIVCPHAARFHERHISTMKAIKVITSCRR